MKKIIIALLILVAIGIGVTHLVFRMNFNRRNIVAQLEAKKSMINLLIAGSNNFQDNRFNFYCLVSINPEKNSIGFTFIPPSYSIDVNDDGSGVRIDSVEINDFERIANALEKDLGLKVPFYISLYSVDAARIADLLEGISLFIFEENKLLTGLASGVNYMDGGKCMEYINNVENNSIFYKYDRIMDIIFSLNKNRERYTSFVNKAFINHAIETLGSNLTPREIESLAQLALKNSALYWTLLPGKLETDNTYVMDEIAKKVYKDSFLKKLVIDQKGEKNIKVAILNGTRVSGLAMKQRYALMKDGINVVEFGTYRDQNLATTIIIDQKGDPERLISISSKLGVDNNYHVIDSTRLHDILVIIGNDLGANVDE